jgi:hypothetical protein
MPAMIQKNDLSYHSGKNQCCRIPVKSLLAPIHVKHFNTGRVGDIIGDFVHPFDVREHLVPLHLRHDRGTLVPPDLFIGMNPHHQFGAHFLRL